MAKSRIDKYLENKGVLYGGFESEEDLRKFVKNNENILHFKGEESGNLIFKKTKSGRRYVQFTPSKCYLD